MRCFVFPGQGSQQSGMGTAYVDDPAWELVTEASDLTGRDVPHLLCDADADELVATRNAQLATFVQSMMTLAVARRAGLDAAAYAGHSLGEFSALCAAGVITYADGVRLVHERGEAMQECITLRPGTMAAVLGLDEAPLAALCESTDGAVWIANDNAPGQIVIAGDPDAVAAAGDAAKDAGAKRVVPLDVSGAFHTPFMAPASERLQAAIDATPFADVEDPVVANVDAAAHTAAADWPALMAAQLTSTVRWTGGVTTLIGLGADTFVELGPGAVLVGTIKRIDRTTARHQAMTPDEVTVISQAMDSAT